MSAATSSPLQRGDPTAVRAPPGAGLDSVDTSDIEALDAWLARSAWWTSAPDTPSPEPPTTPEEPATRRRWWSPPEAFIGAGEKQAPLLTRSDGETIFYRNSLNWIAGMYGSGKSWVGLISALQSPRTLYWDWESKAATHGDRALLLGGLAHLQDNELFRHVRGDSLFYDYGDGDEAQRLDFADAVEWLGDGLLVIDTAGSAHCPMDGGDVRDWIAHHIDPWRKTHDPTILVIDHLPKSKDRAPGPIGSQHKAASADGAVLSIVGRNCWSKAGVDGRITLLNEKDRHGDLPAPSGHVVATIHGTWTNGAFGYEIKPPADGDGDDDSEQAGRREKDAAIENRILEHIETHGQIVGVRELRTVTKASQAAALGATTRLMDADRIERIPHGRGYAWTTNPQQESI